MCRFKSAIRGIQTFSDAMMHSANFGVLLLVTGKSIVRLCSEKVMNDIYFGPWKLGAGQIFYESPLSYGLVNLKPIVPGHVLVIPKRVCPRFGSLTHDEVVDLYLSVHHIGPVLEKYYGCSALNIAMQDGSEAGQSVPHVHCHILPRKSGDFRRNDDVYEELEKQDLNKVFQDDRKPRTMLEMEEESLALRELFPSNRPQIHG